MQRPQRNSANTSRCAGMHICSCLSPVLLTAHAHQPRKRVARLRFCGDSIGYETIFKDFTDRAVQIALLHAIRSPSKPLRHVVGTNVAVIVGVGGMPTWPELLMSIVQCLESNDPNALEGALDALYKVRTIMQDVHGVFLVFILC